MEENIHNGGGHILSDDELAKRKYRFFSDDELVNFYSKDMKKDEIYSVISQVRGEPFTSIKGEEKYIIAQMLQKVDERLAKMLQQKPIE